MGKGFGRRKRGWNQKRNVEKGVETGREGEGLGAGKRVEGMR